MCIIYEIIFNTQDTFVFIEADVGRMHHFFTWGNSSIHVIFSRCVGKVHQLRESKFKYLASNTFMLIFNVTDPNRCSYELYSNSPYLMKSWTTLSKNISRINWLSISEIKTIVPPNVSNSNSKFIRHYAVHSASRVHVTNCWQNIV